MSSYRSVVKSQNWRHGYSKTATYASWNQLIQRATNPKHNRYKRYQELGVTVTERWTGKNGFLNFLADVGEKPSPSHSIERIDNHKGYYPENCRWATDAEQRRNQQRNHLITFNGETLCLADWGTRYGITGRAIYKRLCRGWTYEDAITKPLRVTKLTHKHP